MPGNEESERSSIIEPIEINRRPGQYAAVSRFGSVLWNVQDYIETSAILSSILTVGALARIRATQTFAGQLYYSTVGLSKPIETSVVQNPLGEINQLDAGIAHGAEGFASIEPLLQSLRAESFHQAVYEAAGVTNRAKATTRLLRTLQDLAQ